MLVLQTYSYWYSGHSWPSELYELMPEWEMITLQVNPLISYMYLYFTGPIYGVYVTTSSEVRL